MNMQREKNKVILMRKIVLFRVEIVEKGEGIE